MMEHDVPSNLFLQSALLPPPQHRRLRTGASLSFAASGKSWKGYFGSVEKVPGPGGRSKVLICRK